MKRIAFILMAAAVVLTTSCKDDKDVAVTGVELDKKTLIELPVNGTINLTATVKPDNATNKEVEWSTGNANVADVSQTGVVTAKNIAGETKITVKSKADPTKSASVDVKVIIPKVAVTGVELSKTAHTFIIGDADLQLTATVKPSNADVKDVTWTSSKPEVATVSITGLVKAVGLGEATITVKTVDGAKEAKCEIVVDPIAVTSITLAKKGDEKDNDGKIKEIKEIELVMHGNAFELVAAEIKPDNATIKTITWTSGNNDIATVDANGKVSAKGVGETKITAAAHNGVKAEVQVKVVMIRISKSMELIVGEIPIMEASPSKEINDQVQWSSSKPAVAEIDATGMLKALSIGNTEVTASVTIDGVEYESKSSVDVIQGGTDYNVFDCDPDADPEILKLFHGGSSKIWTWNVKDADPWKGTVWGNGGYQVNTDIEWWGQKLDEMGKIDAEGAYMTFSSDGSFSKTNTRGLTQTGTFCISLDPSLNVLIHDWAGGDGKKAMNNGRLYVSVPVLNGINPGDGDPNPKFWAEYFLICKLTADEMILANPVNKDLDPWGGCWYWRFKVKTD